MAAIPLPVVAVVLLGALCHASWNAVVKRGADTFMSSVLVSAGCGVVAAIALPFLPQPAPASWPCIGASVAAQIVYIALLAAAYRSGEMSQTYPLMRGVAPLLVALASTLFIGENLSGPRWIGIGLISLGVIAMAFTRRAGPGHRTAAVGFALLNAAVIAAYTLIDGVGVRLSGHPVSYGFWTFVLAALPLVAWVGATRRRAALDYAVRNWRVFVLGGGGSLVSYTCALWAMSVAPVAIVAALRETGILFATAISAFGLKERVGPLRLTATGVILAGVVVVRGL